MYNFTQDLLLQLTEKQTESLLEIKEHVEIKIDLGLEQYAAMYLDGYTAGYAYFTLTKNWLRHCDGVELASSESAYLAGWYEGQLHARYEWRCVDEE